MLTQESWAEAKRNLRSRIAEAIVETLLRDAGNDVRRFGQEWRTTKFCDLSLDMFDYVELSERCKKKPDFVIKNVKNGVECVEVKFRQSEDVIFHYWDAPYLEELNDLWPGTNVVIVNPVVEPKISVLVPPYLDKKRKVLKPILITEIVDWGVSPDLLARCIDVVNKLLPQAKNATAGES